MRYGKIGAALLGILLVTPIPVPAQPVSYSSSQNAMVIASATLPSVNALPLYMRVIGGRIIENKVSGISTASGIYYQISGTAELSIDGTTSTLHESEGIFIPGGATLTIRPLSQEPPSYLQFLLSPIAYYDLPDMGNGNGRELYRSSAPIPALGEGRYIVNLKKVTLPLQAPPDPLHRRSGASMHFVLSGFGAETINGTAQAKGPGSLSYEPAETVYQWSNPGNLPLTYLVFNVSGEAETAIVAAAR